MRIFKLATYTLLYLITAAIVISSILLKPHPIDSPTMTVIRSVIVFFASVLLTKYFLYMFISPWYGLMASREDDLVSHFVKGYQPLVSVMIPAWNEECGLLGTVKSLLASTYRNLELVVVNDGSTDGSDAMMKNFVEKYEREMAGVPGHVKIIYYYQQNGGKGSALNTAIKLSHGEILLSIDADCIVDAGAVEAFVKAFRDPRTMAAVGCVRIGNIRTLVGTTQMLEYRFGFMLKKCDSLFNTIYIIGGAAGAFRREVFEKIGGYSISNLTEDIQLSMRIQDQGWRTVYVPDAVILTEGASTLQGLMKQRLRWKRGRFQTFWEYRHMFFSLNPRHSKLLCWLVLPMAMFSELQLGLEPLFLLILYAMSFVNGDFSAFVSGIIVVSLMFAVQAWDVREGQTPWDALLAPIGWLLFYVCTLVEFYSLVKSIWMILRGQELRWQKWVREGITDK